MLFDIETDSVADPECLSRGSVPEFFHPGSREKEILDRVYGSATLDKTQIVFFLFDRDEKCDDNHIHCAVPGRHQGRRSPEASLVQRVRFWVSYFCVFKSSKMETT
jgi:hypothetical protein